MIFRALTCDVETALKGDKIRQSYGGACYRVGTGEEAWSEHGRYGGLATRELQRGGMVGLATRVEKWSRYGGLATREGTGNRGQEWWGLLQGRGTGNQGEKWWGGTNKNGICKREGWNKAQEVDGRGSVELATIRGLPFFQKTYNANRQMMRSWMPSPLLPYSRPPSIQGFQTHCQSAFFCRYETCGDTQIQVAADCCHL